MSEFSGVPFDVNGDTSLYAIAYHPQTDPLVRKAALTLIHELSVAYPDDEQVQNPTVSDTYRFCEIWCYVDGRRMRVSHIAPLYDIRNMGQKKADIWFDLVTAVKEQEALPLAEQVLRTLRGEA